MTEMRKIVAIAEYEEERRTAIFDEDAPLKEVIAWAKMLDNPMRLIHKWHRAQIFICEDELAIPPGRDDPFGQELMNRREAYEEST